MINNRSKLVEVCVATTKKNALNEKVATGYEVLFSVDMAISVANGSTNEVMNVLAAHSTHIGITRDNRITTTHIIRDGEKLYAIDYVDTNRNLQILNLRLVESL